MSHLTRLNHRSPEELEHIVIHTRLLLYNRGFPHGPHAIYLYLTRQLFPYPPSPTTIYRILARHGLTHARTGHYHEDD
jgi:hypothetical protein